MSTQPSNSKQPPSAYTVILFLTMLFMIIAVIAMWWELNRWAPNYWRTNEANPTVMVMPSDDLVVREIV